MSNAVSNEDGTRVTYGDSHVVERAMRQSPEGGYLWSVYTLSPVAPGTKTTKTHYWRLIKTGTEKVCKSLAETLSAKGK